MRGAKTTSFVQQTPAAERALPAKAQRQRSGQTRLPQQIYSRWSATIFSAKRGRPRSFGLPQLQEGRHPHGHFSASAWSLSRPAAASLALTPAGSLGRLERPLSRGSSLAGYPPKLLVSFRIHRQLSGSNLPPLMICALRGALPNSDNRTGWRIE
jgi:hypothetical protein